MQIAELIALASVRSGIQRQELGAAMGHADKTRISKMASGRLKADASEIIYLAQAAKMQPIEVLAEIESERHPELAAVWKTTIEGMKSGITSLYFVVIRLAQRPRLSAL